MLHDQYWPIAHGEKDLSQCVIESKHVEKAAREVLWQILLLLLCKDLLVVTERDVDNKHAKTDFNLFAFYANYSKAGFEFKTSGDTGDKRGAFDI